MQVSDGNSAFAGFGPMPLTVADLLHARPLVVSAETTTRAAAQQMAAADQNALIIADQHGAAVGIVTDSDLRRRVVAAGTPGETPIAAVMTGPVIQIRSEALYFEAVHAMLESDVHHLLVTRGGHPVGVLSERDLVSAHADGPLFVARRIDRARSLEDLAALKSSRDRAIAMLHRAGASAFDLGRIAAENNDRLAIRAIALVQRDLGAPPARYCWLGLGSEGRREQSIKTDQDNALVYADEPGAPATREYFRELGRRIVAALAAAGIPECPGGFMASNPEMCRPLGSWRTQLRRALTRADPRDIATSAIYFDTRTIAGDADLAAPLLTDLHTIARHAPATLGLLLADAISHRPPLGIFGGLATDRGGPHRGTFNIKTQGVSPVVEIVRVFALAHGLSETSTIQRLQTLLQHGAIPETDARDLQAAYEYLWRLRLDHHLRQAADGAPLDDHVNPRALSRAEQHLLRDHFKAIASVQSYVGLQVTALLGG
ncbi:MAG: putative nucleotidyltransferase substrate binding domain-containing protein [Chloroflexota bacterium]